MTNQIYKCAICGNIIEFLHEGNGTLMCCGQPMNLLTGNTTDGAIEKHLPVIEKTDTGFKVKIGEVAHPMEESHYIEWISVYFEDGKVGHKHLKIGESAEVDFYMNKLPIKVSAYCNLHGLWTKE